ncbi:MAG: ABC transporter ATP-binding protein [Brevinematia bacterium]
MLVLENVSKDYGNGRGIFDVSLSFETGIIGILGENGAGKSTMFKLILALLKPDRGNIFIMGKNLWEGNNVIDSKQYLGYLPSEEYLLPEFSGRENLEFISYLRKKDISVWQKLIPYVELLGMKEVLNDPLHSYSSGMQKKLHILASLIGKPRILIWDEPYNQLDIIALLHMKDLLKAYVEETKALVLFSSHIIEMVEDLCSHVCILHNGRVHFDDKIPPKGKLISVYLNLIGS